MQISKQYLTRKKMFHAFPKWLGISNLIMNLLPNFLKKNLIVTASPLKNRRNYKYPVVKEVSLSSIHKSAKHSGYTRNAIKEGLPLDKLVDQKIELKLS